MKGVLFCTKSNLPLVSFLRRRFHFFALLSILSLSQNIKANSLFYPEANNKKWSLDELSVPVLAEVSSSEELTMVDDSSGNCGTYETTKTQGKRLSALGENPPLSSSEMACSISCISDLEFYIRDGQCSFTYNSDAPDVIDCASVNYTLSYELYFPAGSGTMISAGEGGINYSLEPGITEVVYTLLDENEDVLDVCGFNLSVLDSIIPDLICADTLDYSVNGITECDVFVDVDDFLPIIEDNCSARNLIQLVLSLPDGGSPSFIVNSSFAGYRFDIGLSSLKFLVTDPSGNLDSCEVSVRVKDTTAPEILSCPSDQEVMTSAGNCEVVVTIPELPIAVSSCDDSAIQQFTIDPGNMRGTPSQSISLPAGQYNVNYKVTDFSGNADFCSYQLTVRDAGIPQLIACPDDRMTYLEEGCNKIDTIQVPEEIFDDCLEQSSVRDSIIQFMSFDEDGKVEPMTFVFDRSDLHAFSAIRLQLFLWGDVDDPLEAFSVIEENMGDLLSNTSARLGANCENYSLTTIEITASQVKSWLGDGKIEFELIPNDIGPVVAQGGDPDTNRINDYCPSNSTGRPRILALLSYPRITDFNYQVFNILDTSDLEPLLLNGFNTYDFNVGTSTVEISYSDAGGNKTACQYEYVLRDTVHPELICPNQAPLEYTLLADGSENLFLSADMFEFQTSDNCIITDTLLTPNVLDCSNIQEGLIAVDLIIRDQDGNTDQCQVQVDLDIAEIVPEYNQGLCEGEDLLLRIDPIISQSSSSLLFEWYDPNDILISRDANPILSNVTANNSGEYEVRVYSRQSNCVATGRISIQINAVPTKPDIAEGRKEYCVGEEVILTTSSIPDIDYYRWYQDAGNGIQLIDSSTIAEYRFIANQAGDHSYFVDLIRGDCASPLSDTIKISVNVLPVPDLDDVTISVCEGDSIRLTHDISASVYNWSGPSSFSSNEDFPLISTEVDQSQEGWYYLQIGDGDCLSSLDSIFVEVRPKPETPAILFKELICPGEDLVLSADIGNGDDYSWNLPNGQVVNSTLNTISILSEDLEEGEYTVTVEKDGCFSEVSDARTLSIQEELNLDVQSNSPLCRGESLMLSANSFSNVSYEWVGPGFSFNGITASADDPVAGNYILTAVTEENCRFMDSVEVVINDRPELIGISVNIPLGECLSGVDSVVLGAQTGLNSGNLSYTWTNPDGQMFSSEDLILLNADTSINGTYQLYIESEFGCQSEERSITLDYSPAPPAPIIVFSDPVCEGEELIVSSSIRMGSNVVYEWNTPLGTRSSLGPDLIFNSATRADHRGEYSVRVSIDDCVSAYSSPVFIDIFEKPSTPTIDGKENYCSGDTLLLTTDLLSSTNYFWEYPGNTSDTNFVMISSANMSNSGEYVLQIENEFGCLSDAAVKNVTIFNRPERPILISNGPICLGEEVILQVNSSFSDSIVWLGPLGERYVTTEREIRFSAEDFVQGDWMAGAYLGSCRSDLSDPQLVQVDQEYTIDIVANTPLCQFDTLQLSATFIANSSYLWRDQNGAELSNTRTFRIINPSSDKIYLEWASPLGCPQKDSIDILVNPIPQIEDVIFAGDPCVDGSQTISLSPIMENPANEDFSFSWEGPALNGLDSVLTIADADIDDAGIYRLEVFDQNNCSSGIFEYTLNLERIPDIPTIQQELVICEGDSIKIVTDAYPHSSASYEWSYDGTMIVTDDPEVQIASADYQSGNGIRLRILTQSCVSPQSLEFYPTITPIPNTPTIDYPAFVCEGDTLRLRAEGPFSNGYIWEGPMGFSSGLKEPVLPQANEENEGYYRVQVNAGGCVSPFSDSVFVEIRSNPEIPLIESISEPCVDQGDQIVSIEINSSGRMPNEQYYIYGQDGELLINSSFQNTTIEIDVDSFNIGSNEIYVVAENGTCFSEASAPYEFSVFHIPDTLSAMVGDDLILCEERITFLRAEGFVALEDFSGLWRQISGVNPVRISNPTMASTGFSFNDLRGGEEYLFEWSVSYGTCTDFSTDTMSVYKVDSGQPAESEAQIIVCNQDSVFLSANFPTGLAEGYWYQDPLQEATFGIVIVDSLNPNTVLRNLPQIAGNKYTFKWRLRHPECGEDEDDWFSESVTEVIVNIKAPCIAFAGLNQEICGDPIADLQAGASGECDGVWSAIGNANLSSPFTTSTEAHDLEVGENLFVYTVSDLECGLFDRDTVSVQYFLGVEAEDDQYTIDFAGFQTIDIFENDFAVENAMLEIISDPQNGRIEFSDTEVQFFADIEYIGEDQFMYQLCDLRCEDYCDTALVSLTIGNDLDCEIPTLITPNNDGINDLFIIPCFASPDYPNNEVIIFNQWGDEVYKASPYMNDWRGEYEGEALNDGTYFYLVNFGTGTPSESGFLIIQR